jgi:uncharacterized protein
MTPQERAMLEDLVRKVQETRLAEKDPEAEELLDQGLGRDPDATYKLAQTVLVQNLALNQARAQIQQLQQSQQQQPARATSFLGSLLGQRDPAPAQPAQPQYQPVPYQQPTYQQAPAYQAPPQYATAPPYATSGPGPAGSFLRSAATTAAGVAAGALAFEGIESLMHGFGHGGGGGWGGEGWGGGGFGSGAPAVEETVINNYYDDPKQSGLAEHAEHHEHEASYDDRPEGHTDHADMKDADYQTDKDSDSFDDSATDDIASGDFGGGDDTDFA